MSKRKCNRLIGCATAFTLGALFAFIMPCWIIAVFEAVIILIFGWMLFAH